MQTLTTHTPQVLPPRHSPGTPMNLILESNDPSDYLSESGVIDFHSTPLQAKIAEIKSLAIGDENQARLAFTIVRDQIGHSFDLKSSLITITASDTLTCGEGICFAKSHLLAALLRGLRIPAGFCYQRVTRKGSPESGYALHGLNAVYLPSRRMWFRLDPRGDKPGVHSEFCVEQERLAYTIHPEFGEIDYPYVFSSPLESVLASMRESVDCHELFFRRPQDLGFPGAGIQTPPLNH